MTTDPLFNDDIERAVIACVMLKKSAMEITDLTGDDFADQNLGSLFNHLRLMDAAGEPLDALSIINSTRGTGLLERCGGVSALTAMIEAKGYQAMTVRYYADTLRKLSANRRTLAAIDDARENLLTQGSDGNKIRDELRATIDDIARSKKIAIRSAAEISCDSIKEKQNAKRTCAFTGLPTFDEKLGGMIGGDLVILAARTSVGKTALALQIAEHNARHNRTVLFVSLEMRDTELIDRILSREAAIPLAQLRGTITAIHAECLGAAAIESLRDLPLYVFAPSRATVGDIRAAARITQARHGLSLLVVDYLQLIGAEDRRRDRWEQVGQVSRDLKALAKELDVPILGLAQLNREADGQRPTLGMLRESGNIEQDADSVWLLHCDVASASGDVFTVELIVAKNRQGARNKCQPLSFIAREIRFEEQDQTSEWVA